MRVRSSAVVLAAPSVCALPLGSPEARPHPRLPRARAPAPGSPERGPGPGASPPEDPGASPGGVELVMSPGLALRQVGLQESSAGGLCRAGLARREAGWTASRWARITQAGNWPAPDSARTASGPTTRASQIPAPSHPVSAGSTRTCLDPRERLPGIRSRGSPTISRPGRRPRCGGADEGRGGVRPARQQDRRERAHRHQPGSPHGRGDETSALTTRTRFTSSRPSPRRLFSGLMVALSCSDHSCAVGPRWSDPRSRGRDARLGVRGAAAPGAAVREIAG